MRLVWVGLHAEGALALEALLEAGAPVCAVVTLRPDLAATHGAGGEYVALSGRYGLRLDHVTHINDPSTVELLRTIAPDVVFVIGWPQVIREPALGVARMGTIGAHVSLQPGHQSAISIPWMLIRGEPAGSASLRWLAEPPNAGTIIDRVELSITPYDTCASLYARVGDANREMLRRLLPRLLAGQKPTSPLGGAGLVLPRLRREDGRVAWDRPAAEVYNRVRALTRPYRGAFGWLDGRRWTVWRAALPPARGAPGRPGEILGPVVSPVIEACGQQVACGEGAVVLLELESDEGTVLKGPALSEQPWTGRLWQFE